MREANEHLVVAAVRAQMRSEEAETASHLKDEFLATVSHEVRTPLSAVLGWARILESKQLPPGGADRAIAAIGRNATALAHMIDDLLDTSRILNGAIRLALRRVDLAAVAQGALDAVRPLAATKNVHLAFVDVPGCPTVRGDAERLQQVIWNLLANAIKFTLEGGRVDVFIESASDHVEVKVVDTGQGISPDLLPHVFERFRQGDDATTRRHTGLGLGLGIARHLVELHGGTVQAASPGRTGCDVHRSSADCSRRFRTSGSRASRPTDRVFDGFARGIYTSFQNASCSLTATRTERGPAVGCYGLAPCEDLASG